MHPLASLVSRSDRQIMDGLDRLAQRDHGTNAEIVAHLVLMEDRRIHLDQGYPSLFVYCTERLGFSEDCAYKRIQAARAAAQCPQILEYLADAELTLSSVKLLAPHVGKPEGPELIEKARGRSKREVERLVASWFPDTSGPRGPSFRVRAIDGEHYKVEMTVDAEFLELLQRAVDLDRHRNPEGDRVKILTEALKLHIAAAEKRKYKVTDEPRAPKPGPTGSLPAEIRRRVHERDQGRCAWVGEDGRRCNATAWIEHDHIIPRARGGEHTVENGRALCRLHNLRSAELEFGRSKVRKSRGLYTTPQGGPSGAREAALCWPALCEAGRRPSAGGAGCGPTQGRRRRRPRGQATGGHPPAGAYEPLEAPRSSVRFPATSPSWAISESSASSSSATGPATTRTTSSSRPIWT